MLKDCLVNFPDRRVGADVVLFTRMARLLLLRDATDNERQQISEAKAGALPMMHRFQRLMQTLLLAVPLPAIAAPLCVESETVPPQCFYYDAGACNQRAAQMGGHCSVNSNELRLTPSIGHYCLLTTGLTALCIYTDENMCQQEARRQQGACIIAPSRPESPPVDPYSATRPSNAGGF
jgi:hypothetical protein